MNASSLATVLIATMARDDALVHAMPAPEECADIDEAAQTYAGVLADQALPEDHGPVPTFDILMLGVGPDGHVASLFPSHPALYDERPVVAVRGAPKPPPLRITLTMPVLSRANEVWFVASGEEKARAVHLALGGAGVVQVPAAGPEGLHRTLWLLDRTAASEIPTALTRIASP
jgi:6-phosphogluconolactonase